MPDLSSHTVTWFPVHELVAPALATVPFWPTAGSVQWLHLADNDPRKWAAVLDGGRQWALRLDTAGQLLAEASHDVAGSTDWTAVARNLNWRNNAAYIPRRRSA
jgi:hypothetical protein